jgi:hypothetical protein
VLDRVANVRPSVGVGRFGVLFQFFERVERLATITGMFLTGHYKNEYWVGK